MLDVFTGLLNESLTGLLGGSVTGLLSESFGFRCFFPSLIFMGCSLLIYSILFKTDTLFFLDNAISGSHLQFLTTSATIVICSAIAGIILFLIQQFLVRVLEGYGTLNPLSWIKVFKENQIQAFKKARREKDLLSKQYEMTGTFENVSDRQRLATLYYELAINWPLDPSEILPTSFGNAMKAMECYPQVMYGLDGVIGWTRLQAIIPTDYQKLISAARMLRDFWVNIFFVCVFLLIETIFFFIYYSPKVASLISMTWIILILILVANYAYYMATSSARNFGNYIRSAFDLYIHDLESLLRVPIESNPELKRTIWKQRAQSYGYRMPQLLAFQEHHVTTK